jgi:hypothetical protein
LPEEREQSNTVGCAQQWVQSVEFCQYCEWGCICFVYICDEDCQDFDSPKKRKMWNKLL